MFKVFLFFVQFYYIESFFIEEPFALNYDYFFSDNFTASLEVSSEVFLGLSYINRDYYFDFSVIGNRENIKILIGTINSYGKLLVYFNINNSELFKYKKLNFVEIGIKICIQAYIYKKHNVYIHINLFKKKFNAEIKNSIIISDDSDEESSSSFDYSGKLISEKGNAYGIIKTDDKNKYSDSDEESASSSDDSNKLISEKGNAYDIVPFLLTPLISGSFNSWCFESNERSDILNADSELIDPILQRKILVEQ